MIGMAKDLSLLCVAHTEREDHIRIISAREATQQEQNEYAFQST